MTSNLSAFPYIQERSEATPGLWNYPLSILSANIAALDSSLSIISGDSLIASSGTFSLSSNLSIGRDLWVKGSITVGTPPSVATRTAVNIGVRSDTSDYLYFTDESALRSNYIIGSHVGGTSDGLNIWDASGNTMIASFSKQSIRFYQNVVGPVFDVGGALADTYNAATFGTGADSKESRIQAAISAASIAGISRVYVPANMYPYSAGSVIFDYRVQMIREGGNAAVYDVQAYGAAPNGTGDGGLAIQSAISSAQSAIGGIGGAIGAIVSIPRGNYKVFTGIRITSNNMHIVGDGARATILQFLPTTNGPCINVSNGTNSVWNGSIAGLSFYATDTTYTKEMVRLSDVRHYIVDGIESQDGGWSGASSIGLRTQGREFISITNSQFYAPRPIVIETNPNNATISLDVCVFRALQCVVDTGVQKPNIDIASGAVVTFVRFEDIDCARGIGGVKWVDSTATNSSYMVTFDGVKCEQGIAGATYSFDVRSTSPNQFQHVNFRNCSADLVQNGFQFQRTFNLILDACRYSQAAGSALSVDNSNFALTVRDFYYGTGATISGLTSVNGWVMEGTLFQATPQPSEFGSGIRTDSGTALLPTHAFTSEVSLGWFRSLASVMGLSYGKIAIGSVYIADTSTNYVTLYRRDNNAGIAMGGTGDNSHYYYNNQHRFMDTAGNAVAVLSRTDFVPAIASGLTLGTGALPWSGIMVADGVAGAPRYTFSADSRVGLYRSGVSTIAQSTGTLNLASNAVRLSMRTLAASAVTASAAKTNVAVDEVVFTVGAGSGATLLIYSGGTIYGFNSTFSVPAA